MLTRLKNQALLLLAVVAIWYGIIQISDDLPDWDSKKKDDDKVNLTLEIEMGDSRQATIQVAIAANLGSAGNYSQRSVTIWDGTQAHRGYTHWYHKFQARRGNPVTAEVANRGAPVHSLECHFFQEGLSRNVDEDGALKGYGDITGPHTSAEGSVILARCAAVVR